MMSYFTWIRRPLDKVPPQPVNLRQVAVIGLQVGLAFMAVVSLNPYFMWGYQKLYYAIATLIVLASCVGCFRSLLLTRERLFLAAAFSLFLIYLSLLPKVYGGTTRWFFLIPFTVALLTLRQEDLQKAFEKFHWVFALSLIPGMLVWVWVVAGLPFEFRGITPPSDIVHKVRYGMEYFEWPGVVFIKSNAIALSNGGVMFRLCGIYDEPNSVGTIAAFCLAVTRFRLRNIKSAISFIAGIMSLSVAFAILAVIGFTITSIVSRRPLLLAGALMSALAGAIPLSGLTFSNELIAPPNITVVKSKDAVAKSSDAVAKSNNTAAKANSAAVKPDDAVINSPHRERFIPPPNAYLRSPINIDDRAQPIMYRLLADYIHSSARTFLFGMGSDTSVVYGQGSAVWMSVLIDYGIIGFVWLFILFFVPLVYMQRNGQLHIPAAIFCLLFLMSFYQRPVIWLPAQLLLYFAGLYYLEPVRAQSNAPRKYLARH